MQFPRIHLNGTSGKSLLSQYEQAADAVYQAGKALAAIDVHNRDYYVISADAGNVAHEEHRARLAALELIRTQLVAISIAISDQI